MGTKPRLGALDRAIEIAGGKAALARAIGCTATTIWYWRARQRKNPGQVPAKYCERIENVTGVARHELRPDIWKGKPA